MKSTTKKKILQIIPTRPFHYAGPNQDELFCDQVPLARLAREYGTPLYIYSASNIRERVRLFGEAFAGMRHMLCYSVKANSNLSILRMLGEMGTGFDIVSGGELERVRLASRKSVDRVVFSGVGKTRDELDAALNAGILVFNIESAAELGLLEQRARHLRKRASIAMRVNPDVFAETHPYISTGMSQHKFGVAMIEAYSLYGQAARCKFLEPVGVSVHIGSQIRSADPFGQALRRVVDLVRELRSQGVAIRHIDAGGGLGISYHLEDSGDGVDPFDPTAAVGAYAQQIRAALTGFDGELLLEPGRFVIAQAGALVTRVLYEKRNGDKSFVITDAAMNDLIRPALYQAYHAILPLRHTSRGHSAKVDVVGPVCETGDFFARDRKLPRMTSGEYVALLDAGAYGMSLGSNYNSRPRAVEVLVDGRRHRLIRRRETMRDLLGPELPMLRS